MPKNITFILYIKSFCFVETYPSLYAINGFVEIVA
jgi:hypothetical protein